MPRTVTLPDGTSYRNVPDDVTDSEVYQKHISRQTEEPEEEVKLTTDQEIEQTLMTLRILVILQGILRVC